MIGEFRRLFAFLFPIVEQQEAEPEEQVEPEAPPQEPESTEPQEQAQPQPRSYPSKNLIADLKKKRGMKLRAQRIIDIQSGTIHLAEEFSGLSLGT